MSLVNGQTPHEVVGLLAKGFGDFGGENPAGIIELITDGLTNDEAYTAVRGLVKNLRLWATPTQDPFGSNRAFQIAAAKVDELFPAVVVDGVVPHDKFVPYGELDSPL